MRTNHTHVHITWPKKKRKQRLTWDDPVSSVTGDETDETGVFLTHGTTEEGLDFVSVFQPVPHTGKHSQSGFVTANTAT